MSKTKILICGATGFIGRNFLEKFSHSSEYDVHAVRFNRPEFEVKNVTWHRVDLRDPASLDALLDQLRADVIIQAAATTSGAKDITTKPYIHVTDNAVMNSYLFRAAYQYKVKHVIFFSCTVMYQSSESPIKEMDFNANDALFPNYFGVGHTKLYIERMCDFYSRIGETKFTAIRHSNIYGPHDKFDLEKSHFFGATITKVLNAKDVVTIWGTGEERRDLLYIDDLTNFVELVLTKQNHKYRLYNCGSGIAYPVKDVVKKIVEISEKNLRLEHDLSKPTLKTSLCLDCTLAKAELGWVPQVNLEDGIAKTIRWYKVNNKAQVAYEH